MVHRLLPLNMDRELALISFLIAIGVLAVLLLAQRAIRRLDLNAIPSPRGFPLIGHLQVCACPHHLSRMRVHGPAP